MITNKICVVGWHFFPGFYKYLSKNYQKETFVVVHQYNKILDDLKLNYKVIKNVGLEFGAYDYYIKNIWDKKSNVLFIHDDTKIEKGDPIKNIFKYSEKYDYNYVLSSNCRKTQTKSNRCFILSKKVINLFLKEFNGMWYDKYNIGYTVREEKIYDNRYTKEYRELSRGIGKRFKETLLYFKEKYKLDDKVIQIDDFYFYRSMQNAGSINNFLADHSIFNKNNKILEKIANGYKDDRRRSVNYYTKWYEFYFDSIFLNCFNILIIGAQNKKDIKFWKKYFKNSNIYGINDKKSDCENIFCCDYFSEKELDGIFDKISYGVDIIIDSGSIKKYNKKIIFDYLFTKMNNWGVYILENLHKDNNENIINFLREKINDINFNNRFLMANIENNLDNNELNKYEKGINGISFHPGICFIFKNFNK